MKALICLAVANLLFIYSFAQYEDDTRDAYLLRSQQQRNTGYWMAGIGVATIVPAAIMISKFDGSGLENLDVAVGASCLIIVGTACTIASVFCFASANKWLKRANRISLKVNEPVIINTGLAKRSLPYSVGIGIPIN
jgi:hypothetical protein